MCHSKSVVNCTFYNKILEIIQQNIAYLENNIVVLLFVVFVHSIFIYSPLLEVFLLKTYLVDFLSNILLFTSEDFLKTVKVHKKLENLKTANAKSEINLICLYHDGRSHGNQSKVLIMARQYAYN